MSSPWIPASTSDAARRWWDEPLIPPDTHKWWDDGTSTLLDTDLLGWWDGVVLQPVEALGWWDGANMQPIETPA